MAQLTVEVPDILLPRLECLQGRLPSLLAQWAAVLMPEEASAVVSQERLMTPTSADTAASTYQEVIQFLLTRPTPQDILDFKVSAEAHEHIRNLLDANRRSVLTQEEEAELDLYEQLEQLMMLLKIQACILLKTYQTQEIYAVANSVSGRLLGC
jgi:hypothetical protein